MKRIINIRPLSEETMRKSFGASMEDKLRELKDEIKDSKLLEDTLAFPIGREVYVDPTAGMRYKMLGGHLSYAGMSLNQLDQQLYSDLVSGRQTVDAVLDTWKNKRVKKMNFSSEKMKQKYDKTIKN